jgi:orotidine-5'-phosphate decarboxylase
MKKAKDFLIFPLDVASETEAKSYVELLSESVGMFKIGLELFIRSGPSIINTIHSTGPAGIFLDLKLHDIPHTVFHAMACISELGVRFTTVHCGENQRMLEAAVEGSQGKVGVLGVTVLTSVSGNDIKDAGFLPEFHVDPSRLVIKRATMAHKAGLAGVVCSGQEAMVIREKFGPEFTVVTPGIRPPKAPAAEDDQRRIMTPADAIAAGSDFLVIGRPIRDAADPRAAAIEFAEAIAEEIDKPFSQGAG